MLKFDLKSIILSIEMSDPVEYSEEVSDENIFDHIPESVLEDVRNNQCKIIIDYGYEGFSAKSEDTILYEPLLKLFHEILDKHKLPQETLLKEKPSKISAKISL